jgi:hypothetical protein
MNPMENQMAKVKTKQQSILLPEEMIEWLRREEQRTGATLSRIISAAVCGYRLLGLLGRACCQDISGNVEQGNVTLKDAPAFLWERVVIILKGRIKVADSADAKKDLQERLRIAEKALDCARSDILPGPPRDLATFLTREQDENPGV